MRRSTSLGKFVDVDMTMTALLILIACDAHGNFAAQSILRGRISDTNEVAPPTSVVESLKRHMRINIVCARLCGEVAQGVLGIGLRQGTSFHMRPNGAGMGVGDDGRHRSRRASIPR